MPVYTIACKSNLGTKTNQKVADAITNIHCQTTGAPPEFVNVLFSVNQPLKNGHQIAVNGNVRSGGNRNAELTETLRLALQSSIAEASQTELNKVAVELLGFPASWGMEGGEILPEPGEEDAWLNRS